MHYNVILDEHAESLVLKKICLVYENKRNNSSNLENVSLKYVR